MNVPWPALWAVVLAAAPSQPARPTGPVIAVVAPPGGDPAVTEALSRFRGEAASVGFEVTVVAGSTSATPAAQMEAAARAATAVATVAFVNGGDPHAFDVWFTDRLTGKTVLGHVSVENEAGDRASIVLAVKAVDFLRARMFDFLVARPAPVNDVQADLALGARPVAVLAPTATAPAQLSSDTRRWGLSFGLVAFRSLQGLGTTLAPVLRGTYDLTMWSSLRIVVGGLGTSSQVDGMNGSARVTESLLMGEWLVTPANGRVHPIFAIGAGVHDVRARGAAVAPYAARTASLVAAAVSLSAGAGVTLTSRLSIEADAGSFLLFPEPQLRIAGLDFGRTGRPGLSAEVTMKARF